MDSNIPPIFGSSPPPFDDHSVDDDENFSDYAKFSVLDDILDEDSPTNSPAHDSELPIVETIYSVEPIPSVPIVPQLSTDQTEPCHQTKESPSVTPQEETPSCSTPPPQDEIPGCSVPPPFDDTEFDDYEDFQYHVNGSPDLELSGVCNGSVSPVSTLHNEKVQTNLFSDKVLFESSPDISLELSSEKLPNESVAGEQEKKCGIQSLESVVQPSEVDPVSVKNGNELTNDKSEKFEIDDNFTDFDAYFDTRPQMDHTADQSCELVSQDVNDSFGDFAAFDAFSQPQAFDGPSTDADDFDDFGDFVEVSDSTAAIQQSETKASLSLGPLPLSPSACLQVLESIFSEDGPGDSSGSCEKINIFSNSDQVAFFDKVTDFDHASGLTVKWSWTETFFGRNILEFVGIDTKNVIKTDKGYIYVPDFASDLSFTPLKPEKISFPVTTLGKKPVAVKQEIQDSGETPQLTSIIQNQPHRPLPLSLNVGALPKDSAMKENVRREENGTLKGKPIDIEEFLSLPTISSILTNPLQKQMGGKVLSEEAKRILYLIPNISYMTSNQLCFPVLETKESDNQSLI